jgi:hypothetical protein
LAHIDEMDGSRVKAVELRYPMSGDCDEMTQVRLRSRGESKSDDFGENPGFRRF